MSHLRVLLLSPLRGLDPANGDVSYTEALLATPPEGVEYVTYREAIERGHLFEHARRGAIGRDFPPSRGRFREAALFLAQKAVNLLRNRGAFFREPQRFFSLKAGVFDLVHVHVFNCRFFNLDCPVVLSSGAPMPDVYLWGATARQVGKWSRREAFLARFFGTNFNAFPLPQVSRVIAWTRYCSADYERRRLIDQRQLDVIPSFLPSSIPKARQEPPLAPYRIGFVVSRFMAKGGAPLVDASRKVGAARPDAILKIVGCEPPT